MHGKFEGEHMRVSRIRRYEEVLCVSRVYRYRFLLNVYTCNIFVWFMCMQCQHQQIIVAVVLKALQKHALLLKQLIKEVTTILLEVILSFIACTSNYFILLQIVWECFELFNIKTWMYILPVESRSSLISLKWAIATLHGRRILIHGISIYVFLELEIWKYPCMFIKAWC